MRRLVLFVLLAPLLVSCGGGGGSGGGGSITITRGSDLYRNGNAGDSIGLDKIPAAAFRKRDGSASNRLINVEKGSYGIATNDGGYGARNFHLRSMQGVARRAFAVAGENSPSEFRWYLGYDSNIVANTADHAWNYLRNNEDNPKNILVSMAITEDYTPDREYGAGIGEGPALLLQPGNKGWDDFFNGAAKDPAQNNCWARDGTCIDARVDAGYDKILAAGATGNLLYVTSLSIDSDGKRYVTSCKGIDEFCVWGPGVPGTGTVFSGSVAVTTVASWMLSAWEVFPHLTAQQLIKLTKVCAMKPPEYASYGGLGYVDFHCLLNDNNGSISVITRAQLGALLARRVPSFSSSLPLKKVAVAVLGLGEFAHVGSNEVTLYHGRAKLQVGRPPIGRLLAQQSLSLYEKNAQAGLVPFVRQQTTQAGIYFAMEENLFGHLYKGAGSYVYVGEGLFVSAGGGRMAGFSQKSKSWDICTGLTNDTLYFSSCYVRQSFGDSAYVTNYRRDNLLIDVGGNFTFGGKAAIAMGLSSVYGLGGRASLREAGTFSLAGGQYAHKLWLNVNW